MLVQFALHKGPLLPTELKDAFARIVETTPAALDLAGLPAGRGFRFEFRIEDATDNESQPVLDRITMSFE